MNDHTLAPSTSLVRDALRAFYVPGGDVLPRLVTINAFPTLASALRSGCHGLYAPGRTHLVPGADAEPERWQVEAFELGGSALLAELDAAHGPWWWQSIAHRESVRARIRDETSRIGWFVERPAVDVDETAP